MPEQYMRVVCGLNNETNILLKERLQEAAAEKGLKLQIVSRYRKEGVYQYVTEHPEYPCVILQEILQSSSPYSAEDVALLTDERDVRVIIVLNKNHAGNRYMRVLYAAGILDALYEEDAYAEKIVELLCCGRSRKEARRYYGIESTAEVEKAMQIIDEDRLKSFLSYIESGGLYSEIISRYEFVASRMTAVENLHLIRNMGPGLPNAVADSELFCYYHKFLEEKPKKRFGLFRKKKAALLEPENIILQKSRNQVVEPVLEQPSEVSYIEPVQENSLVNEPAEKAQPKSPIKEDVFANMQVTYEEESIYDLFGDGSHSTILDFIEEDRAVEKPGEKVETVPLARSVQVGKENEKAEGIKETKFLRQDTQPFPGLQKNAHRDVELPEVKAPKTKARTSAKAKGKGRILSRIPQPVILSFLIIGICLLLFGVLFVRIYGEQEIPMIEGVPVTSGAESEVNSLEEPEASEKSTEEIRRPAEEIPVSSEELEESYKEQTEQLEQSDTTMQQKNEMEGQHVQEENKENEQNGATGTSESPKPEKSAEAAEQTSESDHRQQTDTPPSGTEGRETGENAGVEEEVDQQPEYEISREPLSEEESPTPSQPSADYHGKIVSGDELEDVVAVLQEKGIKSYFVTRENGEGYFSSSQIREKCDPAGSFLVSISGSEAKLIEQ